MYAINYASKAQKFIRKLPKKEQQHILSVIERSRIRPHKHFERLVGEKLYKLRAGNYRIIADIKQEILQILVVQVGHRKNIYK